MGLFASILGHIGDGNFHESILYDSRIEGEKDKVERCVKNMVNRALEMEGTCTVSSSAPFPIGSSLKVSQIGRTWDRDWQEGSIVDGGGY
jgi:hypothetical protein